MNAFRLFFLLALATIGTKPLHSQPLSWAIHGIGGGGATMNPVISPWHPEELFIACDMGGFYRSSDFGANWSLYPFGTMTGKFNTRISFTSDSLRLYVLKSSPGNGSYSPWQSTDGGASWGPVPNNPCITSAWKLLADPGDTATLLLSDKNHIYYSRNGGATAFVTLHTDNAAAGTHLAGAFFDQDTIYAVLNNGLLVIPRTATGTVALSSIPGIPNGNSIISCDASKLNASIKFVCTTLPTAKFSYRTDGRDTKFCNGVYSYLRGQSAWSSIPLPGANDHAYFVRMVANDTATVLLSGNTRVGGNVSTKTVFRSLNGGYAWSNIFITNTNYANNQNIHTGWNGASSYSQPGGWWYYWNWGDLPQGFEIDPHNPARMALSDASWVHTTEDGGLTWHQAYTDTLDQHAPGTLIAQSDEYRTNGMESAVIANLYWFDSLHVFAGALDLTAIRSSDGGTHWSFQHDSLHGPKINDIPQTAFHAGTGWFLAAGGDVTGSNGDYSDWRLGQVTAGKILFSQDSGATWHTLHSFGHPVYSFAMDPSSPNRMYAGVHDTLGGIGAFYKCDDITAGFNSVWTPIPSPARFQGRAGVIKVLHDGALVAISTPRDTGRVLGASYYYSDSSGIFYSTNGGTTWTDCSAPGMKRMTTSVEIDPNDGSDSTWFVLVGSGGSGTTPGIFRTTDRGQSWNQVSSSVAMSIAWHPHSSRANEAYICTQTGGLYYARQMNTNSPVISQVTSFPFHSPLRVFFPPHDLSQVWVVTSGNGIYMGLDPVQNPVQNHAPIAVDDNVNLNQGAAVVVDVQANDADPDGDPLTTTILVQPLNGTAVLLNSDSVSYTPNSGFSGADSLQYSVCDTANPALCDSAWVRLNVQPVTERQLERSGSMGMYPNPVSVGTPVHWEGLEGQATLCDLSGRVLFEWKMEEGSSIVLPVSQPGMYLVRVCAKGEAVVFRLEVM